MLFKGKKQSIGDFLICDKPKQVDMFVRENLRLWEHWQMAIATETYSLQGKTEDEAHSLMSYYEGRYDMACNFKTLLKASN